MNYDLAKKLRDAGFPQRKEPQYVTDSNPEPFVLLPGINDKDFAVWSDKYRAYAPTLSELIEACGDGFALFGPNKRFNPLRQIEGTALYSHTEQKTLDDWTAIIRELELVSHGSTPEEAVANLWLALNTKST